MLIIFFTQILGFKAHNTHIACEEKRREMLSLLNSTKILSSLQGTNLPSLFNSSELTDMYKLPECDLKKLLASVSITDISVFKHMGPSFLPPFFNNSSIDSR